MRKPRSADPLHGVATHDYRRTPLPKSTRLLVLAEIALWVGVICSPFVAFTVNGRVDDSNWAPAILTAGCCLTLLVLLHVHAAFKYRRLSLDIRAEYSHGRLMPPLAAAGFEANPIEFAPNKKGQPLVGLTPHGVWFAPAAISGASWRQFRQMTPLAGGDQMPTHVIDWEGINEWQVHEDSDGPNYYRLMLASGGYVNLKRPGDPALEVEILNNVRAIGGRPVRLVCDIG